MQSANDEQPVLGVVVHSSHSESTFSSPNGWDTDTVSIAPLIFNVHTPSRARVSRSHTTPTAIITFPDIGQGEAAFAPFLQHCQRSNTCPQLDTAHAHYHACFPGHVNDSPNVAASDDVSIPSIVRAVIALTHRFRITRVVGIGLGLGATVLMRAASASPKVFVGLVLVSPLVAPAVISERLTYGAQELLTRKLALGLTRRMKDRFLARWMSPAALEENSAAAHCLEEDLDRRNAHNVLRMVAEDTWREDASPVIPTLTSRILLVTGKTSSLRFHVSDNISSFNAQNTAWLDVADVASLPHDEAPDEVCKSISLFLQSIPAFN